MLNPTGLAARLTPRRRLLLAALAGLAVLAAAGAFASLPGRGRLAGPVPATLLQVIDGDTIAVRARIWIDQDIDTLVRIAGIDAPELNGKCARERAAALVAREFLRALLAGSGGAPGKPSGALVLRDIRNDKYGGRVIARVFAASGRDVAEALLAAKLVHAYAGRARAGWC